ncbi:helix-turn-helix transcriptional regulator [Hoylesella shahii]|jgi:bacteriophage CI repressor helix-turn-helix domain|uniref:helix-turn-helix transcriptional regulator n=1 Tax=Hoylesella shahii TaxID=228603 RepID=UPI0028EDCE5D|nr:helix-turn-helix transcriptional regulator [Hoylesella shahii]
MAENLNRLKVILAEKEKSNKWLSEQLNVGQATISKWCTNKCQPSLDVAKKIADTLGVSLDELVR